MNAHDFMRKWRDAQLSEKSASQQHFLDLCELLEHPKPVEVDKTGESFTFEKGAAKRSGGEGWADVWKKGFFGWEYKGKHKDLEAAYDQLLQYREALENPPLLVVSDMDKIVVHTNFTNTPAAVHEVPLLRMAEPRSLEILRAVFHDPHRLLPGRTSQAITAEAAGHIGEIAQSMRRRGLDAHEVAHFLDRIVFCLFAEDIDLLPEGLFSQIVENTREEPARFARMLGQLFETMAEGGDFGSDRIRYFNGNLFVKGPVLELTEEEIERVYEASLLDWGAVDPSIFGTLFERGMDPDKRSQIGAHYTSREDIETLVEPVVMWPLQREWEQTKKTVDNLLSTGRKDGGRSIGPAGANGRVRPAKPLTRAMKTKARNESERLVRRLHEKLTMLKVLDPACGSGNFLYVTLQKLKDLEKEVILFAQDRDVCQIMTMVGPWQLYGIEINPYAYDLAQMVVWIGYLQWVKANGFGRPTEPILKPMEGNFQNKDAILDRTDPEHPKEPEWPRVDCIVGNPPFLGDKLMRGALGDDYVDALRALYQGRIPGQSDLCCYWFEKGRAHIESNKCHRAGLLATQNIRGGASRRAIERIKATGDIFFAVTDREWALDGAMVHISMVGFDAGQEQTRRLDGESVAEIHANLTAQTDLTSVALLPPNKSLAFIGNCKGGSFDIAEAEALVFLLTAGNPHARPNSDVVRPLMNSQHLLGRLQQRWIIDNADLPLSEACKYEGPHRIVEQRVKPHRDSNRDGWLRENWWRPQRSRPAMRTAIAGLRRFLVTPTTSKHRVFAWLAYPVLPDHKLVVIALEGDASLGILHSRIHEVWARAQGTQLRERESGQNYNVQTCFETFPFPWPPGKEPQDDPHVKAIAEAARELNELRERWLNPPEWTMQEVLEFPGSLDGPWARYVHDPDERGIGTVRYPRIVCNGKMPTELKKRTLTNLYNEMPTWLVHAHRKLDEAVFAAYAVATGYAGWKPELTDEEILEKLLALNLLRSAEAQS